MLIFFLIVYIAFSLLIIAKLLLYGMRPTKTLAWLLVIFTIPIGGIFLYLLLGRNRRKNKLFDLRNSEEITKYLREVQKLHTEISVEEYAEHERLITLINKNSDFQPTTGNKLKLLKNGESTFDAIFTALKQAKHFINLEYYIFENGQLAEALYNLFEEKLKHGVKVRILYDGIGSSSLSRTYIKSLQNMGVEIHSFLPIKLGRFLSTLNYRNHRKIIVVDNKIAFTGGINISDKYINSDSDLGIWHDMHLQIEGPAATSLQRIFALDWYFVSKKIDILSTEDMKLASQIGNSTVQIVSSDPDADFSATQQLYFTIIKEAKDYVYIVNPYIIPGQAILEALKVAALSGVDVRLLLSEKSDNAIVGWCVRSYFESLLQAGVKIYLYRSNFLHSKTIMADDTVSSVGTANMDIRSFEQNYEVNAAIYDDDFCIELKEDFLEDCTKSHQLNYEAFLARPWHHKIKEGTAKIFSPVL